jgi:hypothetical protein
MGRQRSASSLSVGPFPGKLGGVTLRAMSDAEELCSHCGAPRAAGFAACKFCKTPFVKDTQTGAIPCPQCHTLNELGVQRCVQCQTWVVVQCVFCHVLSPHNVPACTKCNEPFAGAPQRFAERQRSEHLQQGLNIAGTVGNVAASFLGAAAGAGLFSGHSSQTYERYDGYEHHHHHRDEGYGRDYGQEGSGWGTGAGIAAAGIAGVGAGALLGSSGDDGGYQGAGIAQGGSSGDDGGFQDAGIAQSNDSGGGGGFLDSLFGGSSDSSSSSSDDGGAGIAQSDSSGDSGGGWFDDNS